GVALNMNVLGYDPYISVEHAWKLSRAVKHSQDIDELLAHSDYITLHVPLMDATRGMIDAEAIGKMKQGAALLNFSRGPLVDTLAVIEALEKGALRSYVTDFPSKELIGVPHAVLTPHLGASTPESEDNCVHMVSRQIDAYLKTGSIVNSVNYPNCPLGRVTMPRVAVLHRNVPRVIGSITSEVSLEGINIENMVNQSRGEYAYTVLDVNEAPSEALIDRLASHASIYRVRLLMPEA
ncbi:MAG: 3-phosphoglycerate dehydrogenase, partial [Clostridiales bacterium]|nr:3-phosphoglycerate dehydrogenase [Clostridiales bacterium]